jgi:hypothetical protein
MVTWNIFGHLVYFWPFGTYIFALWYCYGNLVPIFSPILVYCVKKNLATLLCARRRTSSFTSFFTHMHIHNFDYTRV